MVDFGNAATGLFTGAGLGASTGNPLLALGGGLLGGAAGLLGFGKGKPTKIKQMPNFSAQQTDLINELVKQARQGNKNAFDYLNSILSNEEGAFEDFERPLMEQFQQQTIPSILERFTGANAGSSSALNQTLAQAGRGLSSDIASQRAQLKQNAISHLGSLTSQAMTPTTTPYIKQGKQGAFGMLAPAAGQGFSNLLDQLSQRFGLGGA